MVILAPFLFGLFNAFSLVSPETYIAAYYLQ